MFTIKKWWESKALQIGLLAILAGSVWTIRQTEGALFWEIYQGITRPLQNLDLGMSPQDRTQNAIISELKTQIVDLESQNKKLKSLLSYTEKEGIASKPIIARVVGRSTDHWWQQVILNRGKNAGIQEGYIVKTDGGLVGLVENVTMNTSRVLLVSDLKSQVGITIPRTSAKGVLHGNGSDQAILEFYEKVPNVKVGDLISTSTYSQKFTAGIPIGKIKSLDLKKLPTSIAQVELFPAIRSLDWVTVYPKVENPE
ncbi:rod shape-determining protein MreC [Anabaena sp. FACHB-1237]|uniref:rod shape-determining protein MreC n=1 Tax=Anabaena sp. FACHB-1237 TaxID=2692769 RepID=UPI001681306A|nr:rod shape-determining protein MreC [Anabaena sp. FACHB-1237]MBD2137487.1 rod shape-determining protein MreC [Anabaena sp. FACHB-1237]